MITSVIKHGKPTWENRDMDKLRAKHCMCFHCAKYGSCWLYRIAWFAVIKPFGLTFMITRCRYWTDTDTAITISTEKQKPKWPSIREAVQPGG